MNELLFYEHIRITGMILAYTTAFLFLMWAVFSVYKLWSDNHINNSRRKGESYHEEYERHQKNREWIIYQCEKEEAKKKYPSMNFPYDQR